MGIMGRGMCDIYATLYRHSASDLHETSAITTDFSVTFLQH